MTIVFMEKMVYTLTLIAILAVGLHYLVDFITDKLFLWCIYIKCLKGK